MLKARKKKGRIAGPPSLKAASGAGFSFEDKVAAFVFCEMLAGRSSTTIDAAIVGRVERQAADLEPYGDLLLTIVDVEGKSSRCACSVKSNRQINTNGCSLELRDSFWSLLTNRAFDLKNDSLGLFCATLGHDVSKTLNQLCRQAANEDRPGRLDEKVIDNKHRKIYDSFRHSTDSSDAGLPWHVLARLVPREFDFENAVSASERAALVLCRDILAANDSGPEPPLELWKELLTIARELRDSGGSVTREGLAAKLRKRFRLRDDPSDASAWATIRRFSREWMDEVETTLANGLALPRRIELAALRKELHDSRGVHVIGKSGFGKSAAAKVLVNEASSEGTEVVWIKADQFDRLLPAVPGFVDVFRRSRAPGALLVIDALDGCYREGLLQRIAKVAAALTAGQEPFWKIILICQTSEWSRVSRIFVKEMAGHDVLTRRIEWIQITADDMELIFSKSPWLRGLASKPGLWQMLGSPKVLDLLLRGQIQEGRPLAGEADLVEWWWQDQVMSGNKFTAEERIAKRLALEMASGLTTEVSPDVVDGPAESVNNLIKRSVLRRTADGRLRFDHDLLADWSRVMHLRSLGDDGIAFMRANTKNPPWLRAIRLLSQHLLERAPDLERWRSVVRTCTPKPQASAKVPAEDLQILDALLEGIAYCIDSRRILDTLRSDLFASDGWLIRRLMRRSLHTGTLPDPVVQRQLQQIDPGSADLAAERYRLPQPALWQPILEFLIANPQEATDCVRVELAQIGAAWAQFAAYLGIAWAPLAELLALSAEKELRGEVAGEYRLDDGPPGEKPRVVIYTAALLAASQVPERVAKLTLKAAGRIPWAEGDVAKEAEAGWRGEWIHEFAGHGTYVKEPIEPWPDGPVRRISHDFLNAWIDGAAALTLYKARPEAACEATLGFLIDWPKREVMTGDHSFAFEAYGFTFDADHMYPAFWTKGPFLLFLRENWRPALDMIIRLTNFATDRYEDWWPYEPGVTEVVLPRASGGVSWKGNHQVYAWNRYHMNTAQVVTCALMALEKWLDEQITAAAPISEAVEYIFLHGRSLAFAGVLISIGKRYPELFSKDLKPLLFAPEVYMHDLHSVRNRVGVGRWPRGGDSLRDLRIAWNQLPGRKTWLKEACCEWLLARPDIEPVLHEVSAAWRTKAAMLREGSEEKLQLLRWAAAFDRSLWKEVTLQGGRKGWQLETPEELRDREGEQALARRQTLLLLPHQCSDLLEKRPSVNAECLEGIWQQLQNWGPFEKLSTGAEGDVPAEEIIEHRHARTGLLASLLCLGEEWLNKNPGRRTAVEDEVRKILNNPPDVRAFTADDNYDDCESFLARCVIRCWAAAPESREWRAAAGSFVTVYRYRTIQHLFDEAFRVRAQLRGGYEYLEALALSFSVVRQQATKIVFLGTRRELDEAALNNWCEEWLPQFGEGKGPAWVNDWATIEKLEEFRPKSDVSYGMGSPRYELHRGNYGLDMGVVLAAFGHLPGLAEAPDDAERAHWLSVCKEMLRAFLRTLPDENETDEWKCDSWSVDEKIFDLVARRIFECSPQERAGLWKPILNLPPTAHHHIAQFLNSILLEALRTEPPRIAELIPIWREISDFLGKSEKWTNGRNWDVTKVWRIVLLYGTPFTSVGEPIFGPLVDSLRPMFERHIRAFDDRSASEQSALAGFLTTKAGERLIVDAFMWFLPSWERASKYFWERAVERRHLEALLEHAWQHKRSEMRANEEAFKAFKVLTLNLATRHVPAALEIQQQLGTPK